MSNVIVEHGDIAEAAWDGQSEPSDSAEDLVATREPENKGVEFHVSMRGYTQSAMDELIVEAAASLIVGRQNKNDIAKLIEQKAIALIAEKADAVLANVTTQIIDTPVTPTFGEKKPVTMREFIGLTGQAYLTESVGADGKIPTDSWSRRETTSRVAWMVQRAMEVKFEKEIKAATSAAIAEMQREVRAQHEAILTAEKLRIREAIGKAVS